MEKKKKLDTKRTVEEGVKIEIVDFAQFEEILASFWTCFDLEIDDDVSKGCFQEKRHDPQQPQTDHQNLRFKSRDSGTYIQ
jgi:hypothetical protein